MKRGQVVIVGGGFAGLLAARALTQDGGDGPEVLIVEQSDQLGGLLGSMEDPEGGVFDHGIHVFQSSTDEALNQLVRSILPPNEWHLLPKDAGDIRGLFHSGQFQKTSPYLNLKTLSPQVQGLCLQSFLEHVRSPLEAPTRPPLSAEDYLVQRYGGFLAHEHLSSPLRKVFRKDASELHPFACKLVPLDRIVLDQKKTLPQGSAAAWRERLAFEEGADSRDHLGQAPDRYYPQRYGMKYVIEALVAQLPPERVRIFKRTKVTRIGKSGPHATLVLERGGETLTLGRVEGVLWTAGIPLLAKLLDTPSAHSVPLERGPKTTIVNFLMDRPDLMDGLVYAYCFDPDRISFRLSGPSNFCPRSQRNGLYPFMVETVFHEPMEEKEVIRRAIRECRELGAIQPNAQVSWSGATQLGEGYPMLSLRNVDGVRKLRQEIQSAEIPNLQVAGVMSRENLFFQGDVLSHCIQQVRDLVNASTRGPYAHAN